MADTRTVTVSITINLGNYENLRLEVSDAASTKEEADELRHFLADVLDGYGNNDATAKNALDKYKERILADAGEKPEAGFEAEPEYEPAFSYAFDMPEAEPEPISEPQPEPAPVAVPHVEPAAEVAEFVCSKCGAPVNKLQRDVSMMFNNKILCKSCMK